MELRPKIEALHEQRLEAQRIEKAQQRLARICEPESALQDDLAVMDEAVREEASHV